MARTYRRGFLPAPGVWVRNALIGAALVAFKAILALVTAPSDESARATAAVLAAAGVVAGLAFTALTPLRKASKLGHYATWVAAVYVVLAAVILPAAAAGDPFALNSLRMPVGWILWLGSGLLTGVFCARVADRWSKGDYR